MDEDSLNIKTIKKEYIQSINAHLRKCNDISLLDFILKLLQKVTYL